MDEKVNLKRSVFKAERLSIPLLWLFPFEGDHFSDVHLRQRDSHIGSYLIYLLLQNHRRDYYHSTPLAERVAGYVWK